MGLMTTTNKLKALDFYRKIPRDLTEASLSGAGLSFIAALTMLFLFVMELRNYMTLETSTTVVIDRSHDGEFLRVDFNFSFPSLSCEFASVDVSDVLGTHRFNLTRTVRKHSIDSNLRLVGTEYHPGAVPNPKSHGDHEDDEHWLSQILGDGAAVLTAANFDHYAQEFSVLVVNFYAPWCPWSTRLAPAWERAATIMAQKYNPETDGRILLAKVDCTQNRELCLGHHIQGYPSIRIFRKGHDVRGDEHGRHDHESYYGDRDTASLVTALEALVPPPVVEGVRETGAAQLPTDDALKRPAPRAAGCRIEGFVKVKKVPGNLMVSAHSESHSFDAASMNLTHYVGLLSFGRQLSPSMAREVDRLSPHLQLQDEDILAGNFFVSDKPNVTHDHYLQVVKTEVLSLRKKEEFKVLNRYEYTAHSNPIQTEAVPVVKFHYELSPMQVLIRESSKSFPHFITNLCAIIGGVFTVAGIVDSVLHGAMRMIKKVELGKQF